MRFPISVFSVSSGRWTVLLAWSFALAGNGVWAQTPAVLGGVGQVPAETGAHVMGSVRDPEGRPLAGVSVRVQGPALPDPRVVWTDGQGRYSVADLPAGTYEFVFSALNFASVRRTLALAPGQTVRVDVVLYLTAASEVVVVGRRTFRSLLEVRTAGELLGLAEAASQGVVTAERMERLPLRRVSDLLEQVPGLIVSQHSGDGKANQYYLRGFNLDHGTDLAVFVADVPVNLPTHAHGQGYADINFLIPELVGGIRYQKGPYYAEDGDFSATGSLRIDYVHRLERPLLHVGIGGGGYRRLLAAASPTWRGGSLLVALEAGYQDGPWIWPEHYRKFNALVRYSRGDASNGLALTGMFYGARWNATDQIPERAVRQGLLSPFGAIDPTDGGRTYRGSLSLLWQRAEPTRLSRIHVYSFVYGLNLFSNFTYFLRDPARGDQFEQEDRRWVGGLQTERQWIGRWRGREWTFRVGTQVRHDHIDPVGLFFTQERRRIARVREDRVLQTSGALYAQGTVSWTPWFRTVLGLRADVYRWNVRGSGVETASLVSPKASIILGPWARTEFYGNVGAGFHSNDGRGVLHRRNPQTGEPAPSARPLVRVWGGEVGLRSEALPRSSVSLALWVLRLGSEQVFLGDAGTTAPSRPSRRWGLEGLWETRPRPWLTLYAHVAYSWARFIDPDPAGPYVPGAVRGVALTGLSLQRGRLTADLHLRYLSPRFLTEDGSVRSQTSTLLDAQFSYALHPRVRLNVGLLNVLDRRGRDVEYYYTSRLPGEPPEGVEDVHFHPVEPRMLRIQLSFTP